MSDLTFALAGRLMRALVRGGVVRPSDAETAVRIMQRDLFNFLDAAYLAAEEVASETGRRAA